MELLTRDQPGREHAFGFSVKFMVDDLIMGPLVFDLLEQIFWYAIFERRQIFFNLPVYQAKVNLYVLPERSCIEIYKIQDSILFFLSVQTFASVPYNRG